MRDLEGPTPNDDGRSGGRATKQVRKKNTSRAPTLSLAATPSPLPPLLVPVPAGAEAFEYERGKKDIFPKPGELVQVRRKDIWRCVWHIDWVGVVAVVVVVVAVCMVAVAVAAVAVCVG